MDRCSVDPTAIPAEEKNEATSQVDYSPPPPPPPTPPPPLPPPLPISTNNNIQLSGKEQESGKRRQKQLQFELVQAIEKEDLAAVCQLVQEGTELNCVIVFNKTPLNFAIDKENFALVQALVNGGADADYREPYANAQRPLHTAVTVGRCDMVRLLLEHGADVNGRNGCGLTPVMLACYYGQMDIVQLLYAHGANLQLQDSVEKTALHWAAESQHRAVIHFLLAHGVHINAMDTFGRTALYHGVIFRHVDTVKLLLRAGITVNSTDRFGQTPLQAAVHRSSRVNIQAVVSTSLDYHRRRKRIPTAEVRHLLNHRESPETFLTDFQIFQLLVNAGAVVDFTKLDSTFWSIPSSPHDDLKIALWYYLLLCDCALGFDYMSLMRSKVDLPVLEQWVEEKRSLQHLCRSTIRSHLSRTLPCDIHYLVTKLPIPQPLKNFLNLGEFFKRFPWFLPLTLSHE